MNLDEEEQPSYESIIIKMLTGVVKLITCVSLTHGEGGGRLRVVQRGRNGVREAGEGRVRPRSLGPARGGLGQVHGGGEGWDPKERKVGFGERDGKRLRVGGWEISVKVGEKRVSESVAEDRIQRHRLDFLRMT
ncbi:unnamed protein product [Sphenostylis stenocarpa]|uniref:Uncharacterized protein n=1 Tax=Sphenostylis stenocarpa TaxID=92480 RepID=A0AA86SFY2_9FABA|nr:unnamed protein product [Sphenostylis stenocarpa]